MSDEVKFVVIAGTPVDGVTLWGPFEDVPTATLFAEQELRCSSWWVADLLSPNYEG